jgi:hypothetical protein
MDLAEVLAGFGDLFYHLHMSRKAVYQLDNQLHDRYVLLGHLDTLQEKVENQLQALALKCAKERLNAGHEDLANLIKGLAK